MNETSQELQNASNESANIVNTVENIPENVSNNFQESLPKNNYSYRQDDKILKNNYNYQQPDNYSFDQKNSETKSSLQEPSEYIASEVRKQLKYIVSSHEQKVALEEGHKIANEFFGKLSKASEEIKDFDSVVGKIPFANVPELVKLTNAMPNTAELMYELGLNPAKIATLNELIKLNPDSPDLARSELKKMSESIRINKDAKNMQNPKAPLSQLNHSGDGIEKSLNSFTNMSIKDMRSFLRKNR